jgi:phosphoglucomutase
MLNKIIEKYKNYSNGSGYDFLISVDDYNELIKTIQEQKIEVETLDENLHTARVGRRDLIAYVKQLKEMFNITEIQYLRGLIMNDQFVNLYKKQGSKAIIAQNKTMWEFTQEVLKKLDEIEES